MLDLTTVQALSDEFEKIALLGPSLDLAGLGLLAAHPAKDLRSKDPKERSKAKWELAGLGTLGGSVAAEHRKQIGSGLKRGFQALKPLVKRAAPDLWEPGSGRVIGEGGTRAANRGVSTMAHSAPKPKFDMAALRAAYQKSGLKPGITSAARLVKHAGLFSLGAKPAAKAVSKFVPSFKGHSTELGKALAPSTDARKVTTLKSFAPGGKLNTQRYVEL